ncbi:cytochrome c oxidase assembly protein [Geminicoccaceae bacterium 1502E]|nr:cytochrome c oxidase assembly protein [Geminicoccaceae bacterium 1502E]
MSGSRKNNRIAAGLVVVIGGMLVLTASAVPLYRLFCQVTGFGGTTQRAETVAMEVVQTPVVVQFNADIDPDLPWRFRPVQRRMEVLPGEQELAFYEAENLSDQPIVGRALYNVTPHKVGAYFAKIACFCFDEQVLEAGEKVDMPVSFFVDPEMLEDRNTKEVREITLSYTFFIDAEATQELRQKRAAAPAS